MSEASPALAVRRKDPKDRKKEIVEVAASLGLEEGLGRITARRVAEKVGVRPGLVMHYFSTADELIAASFAHLAAAERNAVASAATEESSCTAQIRTMLRAYTDPSRDGMGLLWLDAWRQAADRAMVREAVIEQMEQDVAQLEGIISTGVATGEFEVASPSRAAIRILALLDGQATASAIRAALAGSSLDYPAVREMLFETAARELGVSPGAFGH